MAQCTLTSFHATYSTDMLLTLLYLIAPNNTPLRHDQRAGSLQTACCCLSSLRIRVEALANAIEKAVITRQLQLMQERVKMRRPGDPYTENTSCLCREATSSETSDFRKMHRAQTSFSYYLYIGTAETCYLSIAVVLVIQIGTMRREH